MSRIGTLLPKAATTGGGTVCCSVCPLCRARTKPTKGHEAGDSLSAIFAIGLFSLNAGICASRRLAEAGLGLMPVGAAFYAWDYGVKHGHIQVLGASSYAGPLLSTLILIAAGRTPATATIIAACLLITAGAALAAKDMLRLRGKPVADAAQA